MAEIMVSGLLFSVIQTLNFLAGEAVVLNRTLKNELRKLGDVLNLVKHVIEDAENKQRVNISLQNWLTKLKDCVYDVENVLDEIATQGHRARGKFETCTKYCPFSLLFFYSKFLRNVKKLEKRLNAIAEERIKFHLSEGGLHDEVVHTRSLSTSSIEGESDIFGRSEEKEMIIQRILHDKEDICVYAICGMGGLGKSTLAQMVYKDQRIKDCFNSRMWICVTDDFNLIRLVKTILENIGGDGSDSDGLDCLMLRLREKLTGKKFFLVLDDVWNENQRLWDELKGALQFGSKGSTIIVTTRNNIIALMMAGTSGTFYIKCLSMNDSLSLFKSRAFANREIKKILLEIGMNLVRKCGGLPLAIKTLGSVMQFKTLETEWLAIDASEMWFLSNEGSSVLSVLRLSYDNLPYQLRQCFAYCCIFPYDYPICKDELIQLWMANGFLFSENGMDMHLLGQLIFEELVWRSFLQDVHKCYGKVTCKMHNLMHDLASFVMKHEIHNINRVHMHEIPSTVRHITVDSVQSWFKILKSSIRRNTLHSIIMFGDSFIDCDINEFSSLLLEQQYLRVLIINRIRYFPGSVVKLKNLRFLVVSCYELNRLPDFITRMHNLQTLKLMHSKSLQELPEGMRYMKKLQFVEVANYDSLVRTPPGIGELTSLQGLNIFIVGEDSAHQISQLHGLNLGGELSIKGLENLKNLEDARSANLKGKMNLASLSLSWADNNSMNPEDKFEEIIQGLEPNENIEELSIKNYKGLRFPNWMLRCEYACLSCITLVDCQCKIVPPFGKLHALQFLCLRRLHFIQRLDAEFHGTGESSFPFMTKLIISEMDNLEEWTVSDSQENFPRLENLEICYCQNLKGYLPLGKFPALKDLNLVQLDSMETLGLEYEYGGSPFPSLITLSIAKMPNLKKLTSSDSQENFHCLRSLRIEDCPLLSGSPILNSLNDLYFVGCNDNILSCPATFLVNLPSLSSLSILHSSNLVLSSCPHPILSMVQYLTIDDCPMVQHLLESIQQLISLKELTLRNCDQLSHLPNWIGNLECLLTLNIENCSELKSLPDGFRNLKSLTRINIKGCDPNFMERCQKSEGEDWPKIKNIQFISIDQKIVK